MVLKAGKYKQLCISGFIILYFCITNQLFTIPQVINSSIFSEYSDSEISFGSRPTTPAVTSLPCTPLSKCISGKFLLLKYSLLKLYYNNIMGRIVSDTVPY